MKKYLILATVFAFGVFAMACGSKTGVPVEISRACSLENNKKYVEVSGFLDAGVTVFCSSVGGRMDCGFKFKENQQDKGGIRIDIEQGTSANHVEELPKGYKREDIKIRDNNGNLINLTDKVKLTGEISMMPDGRGCSMKVTKIEK